MLAIDEVLEIGQITTAIGFVAVIVFIMLKLVEFIINKINSNVEIDTKKFDLDKNQIDYIRGIIVETRDHEKENFKLTAEVLGKTLAKEITSEIIKELHVAELGKILYSLQQDHGEIKNLIVENSESIKHSINQIKV